MHVDPQGNCRSARLCHPIHCNTEYHLYMETINSLEDTACNSHFFTFNGVEFHQVFSGGGRRKETGRIRTGSGRGKREETARDAGVIRGRERGKND